MGLERVRAQGVAQLGHDRRGLQATPGHVADHQADAAVADLEHVVPVAAHLDARAAGDEAGRQRDSGDVGEVIGNEAALQHLGAPPLRDVADGAGHQDALVGRQRAEADLDGELRPVLAQPVEVQALSHRPRMRVGEVVVAVRGVRVAQVRRHEDVDLAADQLFPAVAEDRLDLCVDEHDLRVLVHDHHRVRRRLEQFLEALVRAPQLGRARLNLGFELVIGPLQPGIGAPPLAHDRGQQQRRHARHSHEGLRVEQAVVR